MQCIIKYTTHFKGQLERKMPHLSYNMLLCHHSLRLILISEMLKGGRDVHLEINEVWQMKTVALLIKIYQKEYCF